jgi:hypothetical protein
MNKTKYTFDVITQIDIDLGVYLRVCDSDGYIERSVGEPR